jgi:N-acetylglucosaminyldiphosphoundecaprenol N-acetyl-beta-D-mannosaminyltransferase
MTPSHQDSSCQFQAIDLAGVRIHLVDRAGLLAQIARAVETGRGGLINNVNINAMNLAWVDWEFRAILNHSDLVFVDGYGVILGARAVGIRLSERLTFADWMDELFELCVSRGWTVFYVGDTEEVGKAFESYLTNNHLGLRVAGRHHGFFDHTSPESDALVTMINDSGADILVVGMGMPLQEKWIWCNRHRLRPPVKLTSGGYTRIATGILPRGPRWMTDHGLEWLYRLCIQPRHTWRRYLIGNPLFFIRILRWRWLCARPSDQPSDGRRAPR